MVRVDARQPTHVARSRQVDRSYDKPLDIAALARVALTSEATSSARSRTRSARRRTASFSGADCGLRDPFGNPLRITQPAPQPIKIPTPEEFAADAN